MVIGLMGGVGSGKSTVLNFLQEMYNADIIQTDHIAKEIMEPGNDAFREIENFFPTVIEEGKINSTKLAKIVFADKDALTKLNAITHPATIKETIDRIKTSKKEYVVVESALLIGTGIEDYCDVIWYVYCDKEIRIQRLVDSRGYSREKAESIIANQMSDDEFREFADVVIDNTHNENATYKQIHNHLIVDNKDK